MSTPAWHELEEWTTRRIHGSTQQMLADQVTEFLVHAKHQRRRVDIQEYSKRLRGSAASDDSRNTVSLSASHDQFKPIQ